MWLGPDGRWRQAAIGVLSTAVVILSVAPLGGEAATAAAAQPAATTPPTTTTRGKPAGGATTPPTTTPPTPAVPTSLTDGQSVRALLSQAEALGSIGADTTGV